MKVFSLPARCAAVLFDMDSTLYSNSAYAQSQIDLPVERLARRHGVSFDEMSGEIARYRKEWADGHEGRKISLANIFLTFGVSIDESCKWRGELCRPEDYLCEDRRLRSALERLKSRFLLSVVSNNPVSVAERTLAVLGAGDLFHAIVGLDTCGVSKPHAEPFLRAADLCGAGPEDCVSVGDRYDIDIALPLELGMGGILVDGVEDVYKLPELLLNRVCP
ncbi:MAG: HAD family hydrolase [Treponema sp.]|nr:HAD family hydrolase [Treponema sp.]